MPRPSTMILILKVDWVKGRAVLAATDATDATAREETASLGVVDIARDTKLAAVDDCICSVLIALVV